MQRESPVARWCFTINNWTQEEWESLLRCGKEKAKYLCIGKEVGSGGTRHLQGYVNFKNKRRLRQVKALPGFMRAHLEAAKGTEKQASEYCKKDGDYLEIGESGCSGRRVDLETAAKILTESGGNLKCVAEACPSVFIKYGRGLRDFVGVMGLKVPRNFKSTVIVICGDPGCGKTKYVMEDCEAKGLSMYWKPRGIWWDGYAGEDVVVYDDFYGWCPYDEMLRVMDRYPLKVPVKGGYVEFVSKIVYITSNVKPEEWYTSENIKGKIQSLFRRINVYLEGFGGEIKVGTPMYPVNY
nr:replication-associated protein [Human-associated circovirus 2]